MMRTVAVLLCAVVASGGSAFNNAPPRAHAVVRSIETTIADTSALRDSVLAAELRFLAAWDSAWKFSERDRHQFSTFAEAGNQDGTRHQNYHCHPEFRGPRSAALQGRIISASRGWFAVCPSFDLGDIKTPVNERRGIDEALMEERRDAIRIARANVIAKLDTVARALPHDNLIAGQRIRLLVDQGELGSALAVAQECRANAWWCRSLEGYVRAARGEMVQADSAFAAAVRAMPQAERCAWTDYRALIDPQSRDEYASVSCEKRDALNTRMWWLADPLYVEPGNERQVEQNARAVLLALRSALGRDERYDWSTDFGGDARRVMVTQYGWPSYVFWGGPLQDMSHTAYLAANMSRSNEPYTTYEYFGSRIHTVPVWHAIANPFQAPPSDWALTAFAARQRAPTPLAAGVAQYWWPIEHFEPRTPLVQLPAGQYVTLRRQRGAALAFATDLDARELARKNGDTLRGVTLIRSEGPGVFERVLETGGVVGKVLTLYAPMSAVPAVMSVELAGGIPRGPPGARLRFGVTPPAPLSAMAAGEVAVSDPVILRPPADSGALPNDPDHALAFMASSRVVPQRGTLGVYWETYGFAPSDSVEIAVWIERATTQSIARRFGIVLGVATDLNTPVASSWREPASAHRAYVSNDGGVPIIGRSVLVDLSAVRAGDYRLEIAVRRAGNTVVRGRTTFVVR